MDLISRDYVLAEIEHMKSAFRRENTEECVAAIVILAALEGVIRVMPAVKECDV